MRAAFNGVQFNVLAVTEHTLAGIYTEDEERLLYNELTWSGMFWLNIGATTTAPNQTPVQTAVDLVQRLKQPRSQLLIWMDDGFNDAAPAEFLVVSPAQGYSTDARGGPICTINRLIPDHGNGSLVCDLQFKTWLSPCFGSISASQGDQASILLSNKWSYIIRYNPTNYAEIRIIEGECIFRMDELYRQMSGEADAVRQYIVPPKSPGFQRRAPVFELSTLGDALHYVIEDEQLPMSMPTGDAYSVAQISVLEQRKFRQNATLEMLNFFGSLNKITHKPKGEFPKAELRPETK